MTLQEIQQLLESTGLPVAYRVFTEEEVKEKNITLPFITWLNDRDNNFAADDAVYFAAHSVDVELYEEYRSAEYEAAVEAALSGIFYTKNVQYIDAEKMYEVIYSMEV